MKVSEMWGGFLAALKANDIPIEADEPAHPAAQEQATVEAKEQAQPDALRAQVEAQQAELKAAQERVAALESAAREERIAALIQRGPSGQWYGSKDDHRAILLSLGEDSEPARAYIAQQNATAEAMRQSKLFEGLGSDRAGTTSAWAQIEAKARTLMTGQPGLTLEQATVQVMDADQALYRQYLAEQQ